MRKVAFVSSIILASVLFASCKSQIEKDSERVAEIMCLEGVDLSKSIENMTEMETIEKRYEGAEKEKLEELVTEKYGKRCGDRKISKFMEGD